MCIPVSMQEHIITTTKYCIEKLSDMGTAHLEKEYYYASMPLCVVDSVFSIGVRYEGVKNTVDRLCMYYDIPQKAKKKATLPKVEDQIPTSDFLKLFGDTTAKTLAEEVYGNRQRTSVKNGILKAEAVFRFLSVLNDFGIEYYQDVSRIANNESFELCIKNIPGQRSGISLKYFLMLAGNDKLIKPDRMIIRFLQDATGTKFNLVQCETILVGVSAALNKNGYKVTPKLLDRLIWSYQRDQ